VDELRKAKALTALWFQLRLFDLNFLNVGAATDAGTANRRHRPPVRKVKVKLPGRHQNDAGIREDFMPVPATNACTCYQCLYLLPVLAELTVVETVNRSRLS
jgi:hypothetical protein